MDSPRQSPLLDVEQTQVVLSASRRTDLAACFPDYFIEKLKDHPPERVHTVVVWTKNPAAMIGATRLRGVLERYRQLYVHLTVTGLGGSVLEPHIPHWEEVAGMLPELVQLTGDARRISWRFDPIIRADAGGTPVSNFELFAAIIQQISRACVPLCRTSWVEPYAKVEQRLLHAGITLIPHTRAEKREQAAALERIAQQHGMRMQFCAVPGFPASRCIDGELLSDLHPDGLQCSHTRAKGQRPLCGCTQSIDIGWYSLKCPHGCLYCYASPLVEGF